MIKKFHIEIPLSFEDSFNLLLDSGDHIINWKTNKSDFKNGYIEWKQSLFSLTGTATIIAQLQQTDEKATSVDIAVQKPLQFMDPLRICDRVFNKLDRAWQKNFKKNKNQK